MTQKTVDVLMTAIIFTLVLLVPICLIINWHNTVRETYTISAEVTYMYETQVAEYSSALSLLTKVPVFSPKTEYILVVEYEGECYEIKVKEEFYGEIKIGEQVKCKMNYTRNQDGQENYEVKLIEN